LDGTLPFVEGNSGYAVSIALVERSGVPLIGVVYDPASGTLVHAIKGQGAYKNRSTMRPGNKVSSTLMVFADASLRVQDGYEETIRAFNACASHSVLQGIQIVYGSGAVKNACHVLDYAAACYVKLPKSVNGGGSIWDFAATACIAHEAECWASNIHGEALDLNRRDSTFMNHQGVVFASSEQIARYLIEALSREMHISQ
jgi:3'(2'), 5'-bisphosphate nucleotidase/myo-inositol-1(or 4)-monophosphatase